jgi:hypothetical protein
MWKFVLELVKADTKAIEASLLEGLMAEQAENRLEVESFMEAI